MCDFSHMIADQQSCMVVAMWLNKHFVTITHGSGSTVSHGYGDVHLFITIIIYRCILLYISMHHYKQICIIDVLVCFWMPAGPQWLARWLVLRIPWRAGVFWLKCEHVFRRVMHSGLQQLPHAESLKHHSLWPHADSLKHHSPWKGVMWVMTAMLILWGFWELCGF